MKVFWICTAVWTSFAATHCGDVAADQPTGLTTLADSSKKFTAAAKSYVVLQRRDVEAVVADNRAVDDDILPHHRASYSGVASLKHAKHRENLFVPNYAGLNYEHIHDSTTQPRDVLFEPLKTPIELRVIDEHTVELYQKPTPTWHLESVLRYQILADGTIEMTLECIPRQDAFSNGYIGLFWASYIHQPESLDIYFKGHATADAAAANWIRGVTPALSRFGVRFRSCNLYVFLPPFSCFCSCHPSPSSWSLQVITSLVCSALPWRS